MRCVGVVAILISSAVIARAAEDRVAAKQHFEEGLKRYNLGEYDKALAEFKEGYLAKPDAVFLFNLGQCYRKLGNPEAAAREYRAYLRESPEAPNRPEVERFIADADEQVKRKAEAAAAPPADVMPPPAVTPPPATPPPVEKQPSSWKRPVAIAALGVGAASLATGIAFIALNGSGTCSLAPPSEQCPRRYATLGGGIGFTVGGAVVAAAGVLLLVLDRRDRAVAVAPFWTPSGGGLLAQGSF